VGDARIATRVAKNAWTLMQSQHFVRMREKNVSATTHRSVMANETKSLSGIELGCSLITRSMTKADALHFKKENLVNISEALDLTTFHRGQLSLSPDTHKCVVANMTNEDRCTAIKGAAINFVREA
jgi:hypothetical protein